MNHNIINLGIPDESEVHGLGISTLKKTYLGHSRSAAEIAQMRALKTMFDSAEFLNPGKVFDML